MGKVEYLADKLTVVCTLLSICLTDLDDVERLIHKFDVFFDNLTQQKDKLNDFNALSSELEKIVQDFEIGARNKEVRMLQLCRSTCLIPWELCLGERLLERPDGASCGAQRGVGRR